MEYVNDPECILGKKILIQAQTGTAGSRCSFVGAPVLVIQDIDCIGRNGVHQGE
jgi:hypothetical protein